MDQDRKKSFTPGWLAGDVTLRDGSRVHIRLITPEDEERLLAFYLSLSEESRRLRFFTVIKDPVLVNEARREAWVDNEKMFGLIALAGGGERIVGHAMCSRLPDAHAEAAFAVTDDHRGRGLATILLSQLARAAAAGGIVMLEAEVLAENRPMLDVFRHSGFPVKSKIGQGQVHIEFPITAPESADLPYGLPPPSLA